VTARLVALVMLPVTAMSVLAGTVVLSHASTAAHAKAVDHGVAELDHLVTLRDSLHEQQAVQQFYVRFAELATTREAASAFLGVDLAAKVGPARADGDDASERLGSNNPIDVNELHDLYSRIDAGLPPTFAVTNLRTLKTVTTAATDASLARMRRAAADEPRVTAALEALTLAIELENVATPQVIDLSAIWFPTPTATPRETTAALARFGTESANYAAAISQLRNLNVPSVIAQLDRIDADRDVTVFNRAVGATLAGEPLTRAGAPLDGDKIAATFRGYFTRDALLDDLLEIATIAVRDEAQHLAATAHTAYLTWLAGAAATALASIGVALWLARSIAKPIKDLAEYAHAVNEGQLDAAPSRRRDHGPRETQVAFRVFSDLVSNLQLLDAKANALANCDFDDPALSEPLPTRLGHALETSVAVLSGSIVERDKLQSHLAHQATHDSLTGISNRPAAITAIQAALHRSERTGAATALLFVDLNEFKSVNDSHGHEVGDEVLRRVADRLTADLRSGDFAARLGGDEFIVVAEGIAGVADATDLARRIIATISQPIEVGALRIVVGAAVGIAMALDGPEEPLRLLARADAAMYRAKHHERSGIEIFDADLQRQLVEREDIETALAAALAEPTGGGLQLHYQPVLDAVSGRLVGAEALIRWDRPGQGLLAPDAFIPIAEATALIIDLDCWVLAEATRQMVAWAMVPELADLPVSVNISGRHLLSRKLGGHIRTVLDQTGVNPHRLSIEVTETVLLNDLAVAATELHAVRAMGVTVAIDDFGTGYTSLAHLELLPIDTIKIDRSFISQLNLKRGSSLVRLVTDLGHAIEINIVAEGVETGAEMEALQSMGADHLQGFLLSRPLTPDALTAWAHAHVVEPDDATTPAA
jgi:diguanylate cyclase (GGDEF)-like protein